MKKAVLLKRLNDMQVWIQDEMDKTSVIDQDIVTDELFELLLEYINDQDVRQAFEEVSR